MPAPGQYPNNPTRNLNQVSLDEFKPQLCKKCGSLKRRLAVWVEELIHRFKRELTARTVREAWFCLDCGLQIDRQGAEIPSDSPDRLTDKQRDQLLR